MPDDVVYQSTSQLAADAATLALRGAMMGAVAAGGAAIDAHPRHCALAASAAMALERAGIARAEDCLTEGTAEWRTLHSAVTRSLDGEGRGDGAPGRMMRILADVAVQTHAQTVLSALDDPERAKALDLADRNLVEGVRDGGDLADLVRRRAAGSYHELTPDQQDDVAESISTGSMMRDTLRRQVEQAEEVATLLSSQSRRRTPVDDLLPPIGTENLKRVEALGTRGIRPTDAVEAGVAAHIRAFPDPKDEAALIARAMVLAGTRDPSVSAYDVAVTVEQARLVVRQAQERVAGGLSTGDDRLIAAGQGHRADAAVQMDASDRMLGHEGLSLATRARLAHHAVDIEREGVTHMNALSAQRGAGIGHA